MWIFAPCGSSASTKACRCRRSRSPRRASGTPFMKTLPRWGSPTILMPSSVTKHLFIGHHSPLVPVAFANLIAELDLHDRSGEPPLLALVPELLEWAVAGDRGGVT